MCGIYGRIFISFDRERTYVPGHTPTGRLIGRVSHIAMYPVKGCARIELQSARVGKTGLEGDREYMVVRAQEGPDGVHQYLTQRDKRAREDSKPQTMATLALITPEIRGGTLRLSWKGSDPIAVSGYQDSPGEIRVRVGSDVVSGVDQGETIAAWLSEHLDLGVRLVRASGSFQRIAKQNFMRNNNRIMFQDAYPIHWFMQESVDELSRKIGQEIPWTRFRPNVVGEGGSPRIEHEMYEGTVGEIQFVQPKPCTRCPVTTIDQETGEKRGNEPLTSLSTYKRWDRTRELVFGENLLPLNDGTIKVGDSILELSARSPPLVYGGVSGEDI